MSSDRDMCRRAAAECVALAQMTTDPAKKEILLLRAQEWLKLAYAENDDNFTAQVAALNDAQMQPMQQQQTKKK